MWERAWRGRGKGCQGQVGAWRGHSEGIHGAAISKVITQRIVDESSPIKQDEKSDAWCYVLTESRD